MQVFKVKISVLFSLLFAVDFTTNYRHLKTIMASPGQKGLCGHLMAGFDSHLYCVRCRDKGALTPV